MNKKLILMLLLLAVTFTLGCVQQPSIKSQADVSTAVTNISQKTAEIGSILEDINKKLG